jgi:hypothetical protein
MSCRAWRYPSNASPTSLGRTAAADSIGPLASAGGMHLTRPWKCETQRDSLSEMVV